MQTGVAPDSGRPATGRHWMVSLGVAAFAVAAVNIVAQSIHHYHWWAGFILVPGALLAATGGPLLARGGGRALGGFVVACVGGLVFTIGTILMFGAMGRYWPFTFILPTLGVAATYAWHAEHPLARALHRTVATLALGGTALGVTFLLMAAGVVDFGDSGWWGGFMMLAGVIVLLNALELLRHRMPYRLQAVTLLLGPALFTFLLGLRFLRGDWPY